MAISNLTQDDKIFIGFWLAVIVYGVYRVSLGAMPLSYIVIQVIMLGLAILYKLKSNNHGKK